MLSQADIQQLKDYVKDPGIGVQNQADSTVRLQVTHSNLKQTKFMEIRLDKHMMVEAVKRKLATHCGTSAGDMQLQLRDTGGKLLASLLSDARLLGFYSPYDGCTLHIVDTNPHSLSANGWLEDTSKVQKYVMSDEDYDRRDDTYRKHKEAMRKVDPEWTAEKELCQRRGMPYVGPAAKGKVEDEEHMAAEASGIALGDRCEVDPGGKRGLVRYVGKCEGLPHGYWVGVQYDEPVGRNNGTVKGRAYFECEDGYGGMVRPNLVQAGIFPPLDEFAFSDEDEI